MSSTNFIWKFVSQPYFGEYIFCHFTHSFPPTDITETIWNLPSKLAQAVKVLTYIQDVPSSNPAREASHNQVGNTEESASCLLHVGLFLGLLVDPEDGDDIFVRSLTLVDYTELYPRR
jgi:hypothetical protein